MSAAGQTVSSDWPPTLTELEQAQRALAQKAAHVRPWHQKPSFRSGAVFVVAPRGLLGTGQAGDPGWAAAVTMELGSVLATALIEGRLGAPYEPGFLALRQGPLLEAAVRALEVPPDLLLVNATGLDHPRGAGLALHLGAVLDLPTVGVTDRPLLSDAERQGLSRPLVTGPGSRPIWVSPGWRTDLATAVAVIPSLCRRQRTPEPLREARRLARTARSLVHG